MNSAMALYAKERFRRLCREIVLFCLLASIIIFAMAYSTNAQPIQNDPVRGVLSCLITGFLFGPFVWLFYRFVRFLVGC
jgi:hypothetical protein